LTERSRRFRRWLRRLGLALGIAATLGAAALALVAGTAWGRARVLAALLDASRGAIAGSLQVRSLDRLSPFGVTLQGARLADPAASEVVSLEHVAVELAPFALLSGRIVVRSLTIGPGHVDLHGLDRADGGLLAALRPRSPAPPPSASSGEPPRVHIETLTLTGITLLAPDLAPPWADSSVRSLQASARVELDRGVAVELRSLSCELWRGGSAIARLDRASGQLARSGEGSALDAELRLAPELGGGGLGVHARAVLPSAGARLSFDVELGLATLHAADLAGLLQEPGLAGAFLGALDVEARASGTPDDVTAHARVGSAGGALVLDGKLLERHLASLQANVRGLRLDAVRAGLPDAALSLSLEAWADLVDRARVPLRVGWREGRLGSAVLPDLAASGVWTGSALEAIDLMLRRGPSELAARGAASTDGLFDLAVHADVRRDELHALSILAGLPRAPASALAADLRLVRRAGERWTIGGRASAARLAWPGLDVASARANVSLDGPLLGLSGDAEIVVEGLTSAGLAVRAASVRLDASPVEYRLRGNGHGAGASAALDLRARREPASMRLWGEGSARVDGLPLTLRLAPTRVGFDGSVRTEGIALAAGEAELRAAGSYTESEVALDAHARAVDLAKLTALLGIAGGWRGRGELELHVQGRPVEPRLEARVRARELAREGAPPLGATLGLVLDVAQRRASLDGVITGSAAAEPPPGGGWLDAAFSLTTALPAGNDGWKRWRGASHRAAIELRALELSGLARWLDRPLPLDGRLALSGVLSGSIEQPVVEATLRARLPGAFGLDPLSIEQRLAYEAGDLRLNASVDDARGRWLDVSARLELPAGLARDVTALGAHAPELADASHWSVSLDAARRSLGAVWTEAPPAARALEGLASLRVEHAPSREPAGHLSLLLEQRAVLALPSPGCAPADVRLDLGSTLQDGTLTVTLGAVQAGTRLVDGTAHVPVLFGPVLRGGGLVFGSMSGELVSRKLDLHALPLSCERARGTLDAHVRAEDLLGSTPLVEVDLSARGMSLGADTRLDLALRGHADRDDASLNAEIGAAGGSGSLSATLPISWLAGRLKVASDAPLRASAILDRLPIAPLLDPVGALSYASGSLSGRVDVTGTLRDPQPTGRIELRDAELTATALAQPLSDVQGRFSFDRRSLVIEDFRARDRGGSLQLSGTVARDDNAQSLAVKVSAKAKRFPLRQRGQVVATTSGRAEVEATISSERSSVRVQLIDVDTWLEKFQARTGIDLRAHPDYVMAGAAVAAPASDPAGKPPEAAPRSSTVRIDARDRFWIKREDFAIQLSTELEASIDGDAARVKGRVEINRGYLALMGRVFDVDRGSYLEFTGADPPDPAVSITAKYESRSSGQTVTVQITGRGSKPQLDFLVDGREASAIKALEALVGRRSSGSETSAKEDATSVVQGLTAGLLATSARRELGAAAPIIMIEPGERTGDGRIRAGFELDALVPHVLRDLVTGLYVEGIVERDGGGSAAGQSQQATTQAGVLVELYFPHQLFTTGQWGPGTSWSIDGGWQL
jgi:autotransporter translocation and assembly factor TamB